MNDSDKLRFATAMAGLYKVFNRDPDKEITKVLFFALHHLDIDQAEYCIAQAILKEPRFPIPRELAKYQHEIPRKPQPRVEYKTEHNQKLADHSMRLINGILEGKFTKEQTLEGMQAMEKQYPGIGWGDQAAGLVRYYNESRTPDGGWNDRY